MSERELCILCWAFVAGVLLTLLVLRLREKRRLKAQIAALEASVLDDAERPETLETSHE